MSPNCNTQKEVDLQVVLILLQYRYGPRALFSLIFSDAFTDHYTDFTQSAEQLYLLSAEYRSQQSRPLLQAILSRFQTAVTYMNHI